jgi:hypothetical protein
MVPIANATCLSEYEAVDIDMDLVLFAELLHSEVFLSFWLGGRGGR